MTPFANPFPPELLLHIFALAASHPPTALALTLTSSFAHAIATPVLRRTARIAAARQLAAFEQSTSAAADVRHLAVLCQAAPARVGRVLRACAGAQSVACGFAFQRKHCGAPAEPAADDATPTLAGAPEYHLLGLACRDGWDPSLLPRGLRRLRVQLVGAADLALPPPAPAPDAAVLLEPSPLAELAQHAPALTHLALVFRAGSVSPDALARAARFLLAAHPTLEVLLFQAMGARAGDLALAFDAHAHIPTSAASSETVTTPAPGAGAAPQPLDPRVVLEPRPASFSPVAQWEDAARFGGPDGVWADALARVAARRAATAAAALPA